VLPPAVQPRKISTLLPKAPLHSLHRIFARHHCMEDPTMSMTASQHPGARFYLFVVIAPLSLWPVCCHMTRRMRCRWYAVASFFELPPVFVVVAVETANPLLGTLHLWCRAMPRLPTTEQKNAKSQVASCCPYLQIHTYGLAAPARSPAASRQQRRGAQDRLAFSCRVHATYWAAAPRRSSSGDGSS
jgi:hypothetical protein